MLSLLLDKLRFHFLKKHCTVGAPLFKLKKTFDIYIDALDFDAGKNGLEEGTVGVMAVFDGHGGKEASEMASKLLLDYFYMHALFNSYKLMTQHKGVLPVTDEMHLNILKEALLRTIHDIDFKFSQVSRIYSLLLFCIF